MKAKAAAVSPVISAWSEMLLGMFFFLIVGRGVQTPASEDDAASLTRGNVEGFNDGPNRCRGVVQ